MNARQRALVERGFVPVSEAAKFLGLGKTQMYELVKANVISHGIHGGKIAISRRALEEYAATRLVLGSVA